MSKHKTWLGAVLALAALPLAMAQAFAEDKKPATEGHAPAEVKYQAGGSPLADVDM